jgi:hypothetical protein
MTADGAATTRSIRFCDLTHDEAGLSADEIATGLRQVRVLNDGHDTIEPIHRDPGRDVELKEQAPRYICSFLAICSRSGGFMEDPVACPCSKTIIALKDDGYTHGGAQVALQDLCDEPVRLLSLVENLNDAITLLDLSSSRVEEEDHAMRERSILTKRRAQIIRHPGQDWCRPIDIESVLSSSLKWSDAPAGVRSSAGAALAGARGGVSAAIATAAARQARPANVESRAMTLIAISVMASVLLVAPICFRYASRINSWPRGGAALCFLR